MKILIRFFEINDAKEVSSLIRKTLFAVNNKDYTTEQLETVASWYTPEKLIEKASSLKLYVVQKDKQIVGTASIKDNVIRGVFVSPESIRKGIGSKLMDIVEKDARSHGFTSVKLESSLTAQSFYKKLGYIVVEVGKLGVKMYKDL